MPNPRSHFRLGIAIGLLGALTGVVGVGIGVATRDAAFALAEGAFVAMSLSMAMLADILRLRDEQ